MNTIETIKKTREPMFQEKMKQGTNGEEEVHSEDMQSEDDDGGHPLDLVYDAVMDSRPMNWRETDGTQAKS